jgi:halimadienyl-diphosphate synthase
MLGCCCNCYSDSVQSMAINNTDLQVTPWLDTLAGWLSPDVYSTAWVAMVPDKDNRDRPAWPEALDYVREAQLPDGGWGEPLVYYAHERTITTLAALKAIHTWQSTHSDQVRIERGLRALHKYARDLAREPHETVGFELLLPTLRNSLAPFYDADLPTALWEPIELKSRQKLALISQGNFLNPTEPRAWWFSLEILGNHQLTMLDDSILEKNGSIVTSVSATAAYLAARRLAGHDSPRAAAYLGEILRLGGGSVPFSWPVEVYELVWVLDAIRKAGIRPDELPISGLLDRLEEAWYADQEGLSSSLYFRVNDGDDTLVGYTILKWAGRAPSDDACWQFWDEDHFRSYLDERTWSISTNIHALPAFRPENGQGLDPRIERLLDWLRSRMKEDASFDDKWHLSPLYSVSHALSSVLGIDADLAQRCVGYLKTSQRPDGGWGHFGRSTLEETAHCALALAEAYREGLFVDLASLANASAYFAANDGDVAKEAFWIGKTIFCPTKIVEANLFAAKHALDQLGLSTSRHEAVGARQAHEVEQIASAELVNHYQHNGRANGRIHHDLALITRLPISQGLQTTSLSLFRLHYSIFLRPRRADLIDDDAAAFLTRVLQEISLEYEWQAEQVCVAPAYTRLVLSIPPRYSIEEVVGILKRISQQELLCAFPQLAARLWSGELWSEVYLATTYGNRPTSDELHAFVAV